MVELTREPIVLERLVAAVKDVRAGAVVTFSGDVRLEGEKENPLRALEYSAHDEMAIREMSRLRERALREFSVTNVAVVHRLGRLVPGEASLAIAVAAPHRDAAFAAARFIIDTLKAQVPIWKKEFWTSGESEWVDPTAQPGS